METRRLFRTLNFRLKIKCGTNASFHSFAFLSARVRTHTLTVVSVSVTANQTPAQTPASYLATPLHFIVMLLKATAKREGEKKKIWGREWRGVVDDGPGEIDRERKRC